MISSKTSPMGNNSTTPQKLIFLDIDDTDLSREESEFTQFISERFIHVDRKVGLSDADVTKSVHLLTINQRGWK